MEDIIEICKCHGVDPDGATQINDSWIVNGTGVMLGGPDKKRIVYGILDSRLTESHWIGHLCEKNWVDIRKFIPAYVEALCRRGVKELMCQYYYDGPMNIIRPFELRGNTQAIEELCSDIERQNNLHYG